MWSTLKCQRASTVVVLAALLLPAAPAAARPGVGDLDRRPRAASVQLGIVVDQFNQLREDLRSTIARAQAVGVRSGTLRAAADHSAARLGELAADTYRHAGNASAMALLATPSADRLLDQLTVLDRLARARQRAVADLLTAEHRVTVARYTLTALAGRQRAQQHRLAVKKAEIEREITRLKAMRQQATSAGLRVDSPPVAAPAAPRYLPGRAGRAVAFGYAQLGKPYRWGAAGPDAFDCSGLTSESWARAGVRLPHSARRQWGTVAPVSRAALRPGDLIFYYGAVSHVALYIGGGRMIHAPTYGLPVRIDRVDHQPVRGYGRPG